MFTRATYSLKRHDNGYVARLQSINPTTYKEGIWQIKTKINEAANLAGARVAAVNPAAESRATIGAVVNRPAAKVVRRAVAAVPAVAIVN